MPVSWRTAGGVALLIAAASGLWGAQAASAATSSGQVYVLQGIAGETLSVNIDSRTVASSVTARTVVGPLTLAAGRHTVQLWRGSGTVAQASFVVSGNSSLDLVAHRFPDASRAPTVTTFNNDLSPVQPGRSRLLVAHTAVVPPADIVVNGSVLISNIANGESATNVVPAGAYKVAIVTTATTGPPVLGPTTLKVTAGTLTNVFAIGDPTAGTMDAIVQVLPVTTKGAAVPKRVNTGDGGQAAGLFSDEHPAGAGITDASIAGAGIAAAAALCLALTARSRRPALSARSRRAGGGSASR